MVLLYVDVLGTRARWHAAGRPGAEEVFRRLRGLTIASLQRAGASNFDLVGIESDSAVARSDSLDAVLSMAREMFTTAFLDVGREPDNRMWLRGAILPTGGRESLRTERAEPAPLDHVKIFQYSNELLDAIQVERSGVKGMRLLVPRALAGSVDRTRQQVRISDCFVYRFRSLDYSGYPPRLRTDYEDYLWMFGDNVTWNRAKRAMSDRLRYAAGEPEEFLHAASTQVVFNECEAILRAESRRRA